MFTDKKKKADPALDPTPDTTPHPRGSTSFDQNAQDARVAAARRERARIVRGQIPNSGNVGHGQRGVSGVERTPKREQRKG